MCKKAIKYIVIELIVSLLIGCSPPEAAQELPVKMAEKKSVSDSDGMKPQEPVNVQQQPEPDITIVMVGDILLHTAVNESGEMEDGTYNYNHLFENVRTDIEEADLAIANQEVILGGTEIGLSGYPAFNGAFEVGDALCDAGFDVILHATNHALDKGKRGLLNCLHYWETNHPEMSVLGIYESAEEHEEDLFLYEKDDIKIAILNYTYGTNGIALPADMPFAVNMLDKDQVKEDVIKAEEKADFIIVCPHWGTEYNLGISKQQEEYAKLFADLGVDLVIGTHPHVIEPISWVESTVSEDATQEEPHKMLVYYSIGNYINATSRTGDGVAAQAVGAMAKITISKDKKGEAIISDYAAIPLVTQMLTGPGLITTYKLSDYSERLAESNEMVLHDSAFSYQYCEKLCKDIFGNHMYEYR